MYMRITKTDYLEYTYCRKNLWLKKHKPELFNGVELSEFERKIIDEGNLADEAARNLFPEGVLVEIVGPNAVGITQSLVKAKTKTIFQGGFVADEFFVQADVLRFNEALDGWELYEVKATNDVKRKVPHHHVNDLAFQKIVIEQCGVEIKKAGVIHLNSEYRKCGEIDYEDLFIIAELTDEVLEAEEEVRDQMNDLKAYMYDPEGRGCECLSRGRNNQCTTFAYSNPQVPEYSIHDINRIGGSKRLFYDWVDRGVFLLEDIDNPEKLTGAKKSQYDAYMSGKPLVDHEGIKEMLDGLAYPLQFFDYEAYTSAIPRFNGFGTYEHVPFQYSLHILHEDGEMKHKECLIKDPSGDLTLPLIEQMKEDFDDQGAVISWHKSYEIGRNNKLAELHPEHAGFLESLNDRMFDIKEIFSKNLYVDARFKGSSSIKKVLPVLVPELSYDDLAVQKGDQALERWEKMIDNSTPQEEKDQIEKDLLEYCKLDTLAMVRIYEFLKGL
jgi:hypothetical protein